MLYSQGVRPEEVGVPRVDGGPVETDPRKIWRRFAANFHLFRGTPSWLWLYHAFTEVFGVTERLSAENADRALRPHRRLPGAAGIPSARPVRALQYRGADHDREPARRPPLASRAIKASGWRGRVLTAFRPDPVVDPAFPGFRDNLDALGRIAGGDVSTWQGYLAALAERRAYFKSVGCTSTDHGHPTARTADLSPSEAAALFDRVRKGGASAAATPNCSAPRC